MDYTAKARGLKITAMPDELWLRKFAAEVLREAAEVLREAAKDAGQTWLQHDAKAITSWLENRAKGIEEGR